MPAGIVNNSESSIQTKSLISGDFIIMMSDGVYDSLINQMENENNILDFIHSIDTINPQAIAEKLLDEAKKINEGIAEDDMTVLVSKIWKKAM